MSIASNLAVNVRQKVYESDSFTANSAQKNATGETGAFHSALTKSRQNRFHRNWLYTSWWNWTSWALTMVPSVRGQRSAAELASSFLQFAQFFSPQLFVSRIVPFVVATFNSRPPPPTVPESSFELKLPCTVTGKSV
jgi:hypothetical protein